MTDFEVIMSKVAELDETGGVWWNSSLEVFVPCNDFFSWGCSDCEPLLVSDIPELERAVNDSVFDGLLLYCSRKRKMRPQGRAYSFLDEETYHLFDECGPKRDVGLGNPVGHPDDADSQP